MSAIIQLFFQGTGLVWGTDLKEFDEYKKMCYETKLGKISAERMKMELEYMDKALHKYAEDKCIEGKTVLQDKLLEKVFKGDCFIKSWSQALHCWCSNILCLVELGELKQKDDNGLLIIGDVNDNLVICHEQSNYRKILAKSTTDTFEKDAQDAMKNQKLCGNCQKPAHQKCQKCFVKYCCRECQLADWKKHKKICQDKKHPLIEFLKANKKLK